ncbi:MAG: hypothetical protein NTW87_05730 [Planctomycetota bacterium]|nr:hypothetical protein [Planctomycetota bacterium]
MADARIYHFDRPPLQETVLGIQFIPMRKFNAAHLGAFWKTLGAEWRDVNGAAALEQQFEYFDARAFAGEMGFRLQFGGEPAARLQIPNAAGDRMIQVQNGRLLYNWLRSGPAVPGPTQIETRRNAYPHYPEIRGQFDDVLRRFRQFVAAEGFGELAANQWEVTYVNHLPKGTVWNSPGDWAALFPRLPMPAAQLEVAELESMIGEWHYHLPGKRGRLHVQLRHGVAGKEQVLVLTLTARGPVSQDVPMGAGLDIGREAIVRAFKVLTSEAAHLYWGYKA